MSDTDLMFLNRDNRIAYVADALEFYKKAGIGIRNVGFGQRPAVLTIDQQYAFTSPESPLGTKGASEEVCMTIDNMLENSRKLIEAARPKGIPIVHTVVGYRKDYSDSGVFGIKVPTLPQVCQLGTKMVEIDARLNPQPNDYYIVKKMPSAFFGTDLIHLLTYLRVDTALVTGDSTSGCVRATVIDSMSHGFRTILVEDCLGDRSPGPHKANLFDMMTKYADVVRLKTALDYIERLPSLKYPPD
ncbi:MAG: isochorismatase family protein [Candidatus Bathyarchaeia archaeon]